MTAEQDGLDPAAEMAEHEGHTHLAGQCLLTADRRGREHCLPYRLAALALDLQGKVARVEALRRYVGTDEVDAEAFGPECLSARELDAALADPAPAVPCPKVSPLEALTDRTCAKAAGHAGACLFAGHDGRTDLEVMPK